MLLLEIITTLVTENTLDVGVNKKNISAIFNMALYIILHKIFNLNMKEIFLSSDFPNFGVTNWFHHPHSRILLALHNVTIAATLLANG